MFLQYELKTTNGLVILALLLKKVTKENDQAYSHGFLLKTVIPMLLILAKNGNNFEVSHGGGVNIV